MPTRLAYPAPREYWIASYNANVISHCVRLSAQSPQDKNLKKTKNEKKKKDQKQNKKQKSSSWASCIWQYYLT